MLALAVVARCVPLLGLLLELLMLLRCDESDDDDNDFLKMLLIVVMRCKITNSAMLFTA